MIKLVRVDHRLLHGQVAFAWTKYVDADCILIASDALVKDELRMAAMWMARPTGIKLVMKTIDDSVKALCSGVTDAYRLFILCENIEDAHRLCMQVPDIKHINLGGMKNRSDRKQVAKAIHVSEDDIKLLKELDAKDIELEIRLVPNDKAENPMKLFD